MQGIKYYFLLLLLIIGVFSCQQKAEQATDATPTPQEVKSELSFAATVEQAHQKELLLTHPTVAFDIELFFGGKQRVDGTVSMKTNSSKMKLDLANGLSLLYDGDKVYQSPSDMEYKAARFDIFTWQYFFAFPFKLTDPGTKWQNVPFDTLQGTAYDSEKLTFESGTGDAPDDWYIAYASTEDHLLYAAAYIVTLSRSQEKAEEDPHAIVYKEYQKVEGVPFATQWEFWGWKEDKGLTEQLGYANISNIRFIAADESIYEVPADVKEVGL